jgi:hypothetical protein
MHTAEPARPALRIGVLDHNRLVDGRVLDRPRTITVGRGVGNTLHVDAPEWPRHFPLVERELGHCWLNFTDAMHGKVLLGRESPAFTLDELAAVAEHHHGRNRIELPAGSCARIELGDELAVVLDVEAPPRPDGERVRLTIGFTALGLAALALVIAPRLSGPEPRPASAPPIASAPAQRSTLTLPPFYVTASLPHAVDAWGVPGALARSLEVAEPRAVAIGPRSGERDTHGASWFADGTLDSQVITEEIERRKAVIVEAYQHALKQSPMLSGRVEVRFRVDAEGRIHDLAITRDTLHSPEVEARILSVMPSWRLPAPAGGEALFFFPFHFRPVVELPRISL